MRNTSSKPPGPISIIDQWEILSRSQVQFITLFFGGAQVFARICSICSSHVNAIYRSRRAAPIWCRKTNFVSETVICSLFWNKFYSLESHTEHWWRCSKSTSNYINKNLTVFYERSDITLLPSKILFWRGIYRSVWRSLLRNFSACVRNFSTYVNGF